MAFNPVRLSLNTNSQILAGSGSASPKHHALVNNKSSTGAVESATTPSSITSDQNNMSSAATDPFRFLTNPAVSMHGGPPGFPGGFPCPPRIDFPCLPGGPPISMHGGPFDPAAFRGFGPNGLPPFGPIFPPGSEMGSLPPSASLPGLFYDPTMGGHHGFPYGGPMDLNGARRKNATRETTAALKHWLYEHRKNPYPTKGEKIMLAIMTKMTLTQVSTWFANARRRLKKENKMTWSPRNRPGEDDDDDDDIGDPINGTDRPSSSLSDISDINPCPVTMINGHAEAMKRHLEGNNNNSSAMVDEQTRKRPFSPTPSAVSSEGSPVKKPKIWSIADTIGDTTPQQPLSSLAAKPKLEVKTESAASVGAGTVTENGDKRSIDRSTTSSPSQTLPVQQSPTPATSTASNGPFAFTFNPWQQQMAAMAAMAKGGHFHPHHHHHQAGNPFAGANLMNLMHNPGMHPNLMAQFRPELFAAAIRSPFGFPTAGPPHSAGFCPPVRHQAQHHQPSSTAALSGLSHRPSPTGSHASSVDNGNNKTGNKHCSPSTNGSVSPSNSNTAAAVQSSVSTSTPST